MKISILTVCPELFESFLSSHEVKRAQQRSGAVIEAVDIRNYVQGSFRNVPRRIERGGNGVLISALSPL